LLVGFAFTLGGVLAAVFPTRQEYAQLADHRAPDAYSIAYLQVLTRANPNDEQLRVIYVRQLSKLGRYDDALEVLEPALAADPADAQTQELALDLRLARARAVPEGEDRRTEAFHEVAGQLERMLAFREPVDRLEVFAHLALELGQPRLASEFAYGAARASKDGAHLFAEAAEWMRASGDRLGAAQSYREACEREHDPLQARQDALLAIDTLESDDRVPDAADLAGSYLRRWPSEPELLVRAAKLSLRCERTGAARDYGRRLVALQPSSRPVLEEQVRLELANGDARAALPIVQRLLEHRPDDVRLHQVHARVAEWAGHPAVALNEWMWLVDRGHGGVRGPLLAGLTEAP
jgi:predicted Zn-dependent protease